MPRLIDANKLIGDLHNHAFLEGDDREIAYSVIQKQPTIGGWISVKDRMPESKKRVLVTVKARNGKHFVLIACHVNAREIDSEDYEWQDAEIDWDYDEENDIYWVPECWYEGNFVEENTSWIIDEYADGIVTHWMPLPEPPKEKT